MTALDSFQKSGDQIVLCPQSRTFRVGTFHLLHIIFRNNQQQEVKTFLLAGSLKSLQTHDTLDSFDSHHIADDIYSHSRHLSLSISSSIVIITIAIGLDRHFPMSRNTMNKRPHPSSRESRRGSLSSDSYTGSESNPQSRQPSKPSSCNRPRDNRRQLPSLTEVNSPPSLC